MTEQLRILMAIRRSRHRAAFSTLFFIYGLALGGHVPTGDWQRQGTSARHTGGTWSLGTIPRGDPLGLARNCYWG